MNDREKLTDMMIELKGYLEEIYEFPTLDYFLKELAMQLVANGVTFATENSKWIPVTERLPELKSQAIALNRHGDMMIGTYTEWGWMFPCYFENPTHWMPLPEPPKGE